MEPHPAAVIGTLRRLPGNRGKIDAALTADPDTGALFGLADRELGSHREDWLSAAVAVVRRYPEGPRPRRLPGTAGDPR